MEVAQQRHNEPIWMILSRILYVWCLVFYRQAMRYLKGGRLFEYVRLECVFMLTLSPCLGAFHMKHSSQSWETCFGKKASMYSCYSLQSSNTSVKWNCTMNAIIWSLLSHPCAAALQTRLPGSLLIELNNISYPRYPRYVNKNESNEYKPSLWYVLSHASWPIPPSFVPQVECQAVGSGLRTKFSIQVMSNTKELQEENWYGHAAQAWNSNTRLSLISPIVEAILFFLGV